MDMDNERPSMVQLEGETEETLKEPTPSQSCNENGYDEQSYLLVMELPGEASGGENFIHG